MTIKGRRKIFIKKKLFESQKKENLVIMQAQTITKKNKKIKKEAALLLNSTFQLISLREKKFQLIKILIFKKKNHLRD